MGILNNDGIVFHDRAGGGWYCNTCKRYIHPDMRHDHKHTPVIDLGKSSPDRPLKPLKSAQKPNTDSREREKLHNALDELILNLVAGMAGVEPLRYPNEEDYTMKIEALFENYYSAHIANKQKELLDSLHREIFSDAGVMDIVEIAKLLKNKRKEL